MLTVVFPGDGPLLKKLATFHVGPIHPNAAITWDGAIPGNADVMKITGVVRGQQTGNSLDTVLVAYKRLESEVHSWAAPDPAAEGRYEITLEQPGTYVIWPRYNGVDEGVEKARLGRRITWTAGEQLVLDFKLPEPFALSARIVDVDGIPITDANVDYVPSSVPGSPDEEGRCGWSGFAPYRDGHMVIEKDGYMTTETESVVGEPGAVYPEETVVLYEGGGIEGVLLYPDGTPATNVPITVTFDSENFTFRKNGVQLNRVKQSATTHADGRFALGQGYPAVRGRVSVTAYQGQTRVYASEACDAEVYASSVVDLGSIVLNRVTETPTVE